MKAPTRQATIAGVLLDMDGVLCDSEPFILEAARTMFLQRYGVDIPPEDFHPFVGAGEDRYIGGPAEKHGIQLNLAMDKTFVYALYLDLIVGRLEPLPGVMAFVENCRQQGIRLAVASSADRIKVDGNLQQIGLPPEEFDAIVCGSDVARKKPDPMVFLEAASRIGVKPNKCLVVEDAPNGIRAGKAAGSRCLGITSTFSIEHLQEAGADYVASDLAHLPPGVMD